MLEVAFPEAMGTENTPGFRFSVAGERVPAILCLKESLSSHQFDSLPRMHGTFPNVSLQLVNCHRLTAGP